MGTGSKAKMGVGCSGKGSSPLRFGVRSRLCTTAWREEQHSLPRPRADHVCATSLFPKSAAGSTRHRESAGKEPVPWGTEPPKPGTPQNMVLSREGSTWLCRPRTWRSQGSLPKGCNKEEEKIEDML